MAQILDYGWPLIICGALLVGIGGLCTTMGWNYVSRQRQARALLLAVQQEWKWNDTTLGSDPLFIDNQDSTLRKYRLYPRFREGAASNLLASGSFVTGSSDQVQLLREVAEYKEEFRYMNALFDWSDKYVVEVQSQDSIASHHRYVQSSAKFVAFQDAHRKFGKYLDSFISRY